METLLSLTVGFGLAAACGFRVFVPLLVLNLAALTGQMTLPAGFAWLGDPYATIVFGAATLAEIGGYYIPWVDSVLDAITTPAAVIAGTLASAAVIVELPPLMKWSLALIAGGGIAGGIQASTVALRAKTTLASGGVANPVFSTLELAGAVVIAVLAVFIPLAALVMVVIFLVWIFRRLGRRFIGTSRFPKDGHP